MLAVQGSKISSFQEVTCCHSLSDGGHPSRIPGRRVKVSVLRMVGEESRILAVIYLASPASGFMLLCSALTLLISGFSILDIIY